MRNEEKKKKLKKTAIVIGSILLMLILGFAIYQLFTQSKISKYEIDAQSLTCTDNEQIAAELKKIQNNYFSFKTETAEELLQKKFFCIGKIESEVIYPDKLKLKISERQGVFAVKTISTDIETNPPVELDLDPNVATEATREATAPKVINQILKSYREASGSSTFLVDENGVVFDELSGEINFPSLSLFSKELKIGDKIPNDLIKKSLQIIEKLKEYETASDNLVVVGERLIVDSSPRIIFSLNRPIERQTASLQLILAQAKMNLDPEKRDGGLIESIDLRFDKPVVVYSSKKR